MIPSRSWARPWMATFCLKKIEELKPNVVTLDLEMPGMNGIDTLKEIMRRQPVPVIVFSSHSTEGRVGHAESAGPGARSILSPSRKDASAHMAETAAELIAKDQSRGRMQAETADALRNSAASRKSSDRSGGAPSKVVAIGISTGGPQAMEYCCRNCPEIFPGRLWWCSTCRTDSPKCSPPARRSLSAAGEGSAIGRLAAAGARVDLSGKPPHEGEAAALGDIVVLSDDPHVNGHRPSADVLLHSVAEEFRNLAVGVLMTGMGDDGAEGLGAIKKEGGMTIAQSEESCVVFRYAESGDRTRDMRSAWWVWNTLAASLLAMCGRNEGGESGAVRAVRAGR